MPSAMMLPGSISLTVMPNGANSSAAERMSPLMPLLLAV